MAAVFSLPCSTLSHCNFFTANSHLRELSSTKRSIKKCRKSSEVQAKFDEGDSSGGCEPRFWCTNWGMAGRLGGIVCGLFAAASVTWDLPAAADTPYAKSAERMQLGLVKGRIQACPLDINPNCVSTSSNNAGYGAPWIIPESSSSNAVKKIKTAILSSQKNPTIVKVEDTPEGCTYLVAEIDGFLGRDVMEFLIKKDVVTYRSMAKRVVYLYPFTTPIGDFDGQERHLKILEQELGWSIPSFENTYSDEDYYDETE